MYQPEKIIIADDHPLFRQALLATLTPVFAQCQWIEAQTAQELEQSLVEHHDADLVLLDLNIPGAHGFNNLYIFASNTLTCPLPLSLLMKTLKQSVKQLS